MKPVTSLTSLSAIAAAAARIRGTIVRTPLVDISWHTGKRLWLKCENLQVAGAFKIRGAFNLMIQLPAEQRMRGVITYSSGNHGQAVAYVARSLGAPAVVVMPKTAPAIKVDGARALGAEVVFEGTTSIERKVRAEAEASARGLTVVPPFDHPRIVAGQGTVGREILEDVSTVDSVYVPIGGGGLIAGVAAAVKQARPTVRVIGVEPVGTATMAASLVAGHPVTLESVSSIADGLLPVRPGDLTFAHVKTFVDDVVVVDDSAIARALVWLFRQAKLVVEPSGAVAVAAILFGGQKPEAVDQCRNGDGGGKAVAVLSGGNIAPAMLTELLTQHGSN